MKNTPPSPPEQTRHIRLYRWQWVSMALMVLLPMLAVFGVFDKKAIVARTATSELAMEVQYYSKLRYKKGNRLLVSVVNTSRRMLDRVTITCDSAYLAAYEEPSFLPSATRAYSVDIDSLAPGERRDVSIEGRIEQMWNNSGYVTAIAGNNRLSVAVHTFVFP